MASLTLSTIPTATPATTKNNNRLSQSSIFSKIPSHRFKTHQNQTHRRFTVSCNATSDDKNDTTLEALADMQNVDRRNLLLGLGGLYGAAGNLTFLPPTASAVPIAAPNISDCATASQGIQNMKDAVRGVACCPPKSDKPPKDFVFPKKTEVRIRPAAQRASEQYLNKYKAAIKAMRDLPDEHPHSFKQQAKIHCAYCNGAYTQKQSGREYENITLQIHNSWLFFPFHRWYLYFYERILGKLIDDPTFALPFWNWDNPTGMIIPDMFEKPGLSQKDRRANPIFNAYRDARHLPPAVVDIDYNGEDRNVSCIDQIGINLSAMYKQMISNATDPTSFFGGRYVAGMEHDNKQKESNPSVGSVEAGCHTAVHRWVADPRMPNNEDMGNFYSAGYDPIFYAHHANVDRMWKIWKDLGIRGHREPNDPDWWNTSYVFYDENEELVRVYNRDCVNIAKLGYDYERSSIPWARNRPIPRAKKPQISARSARMGRLVDDVEYPLKLDRIVKVFVKRPFVNRTKEEKEKANEVLMVNGISFDSEKFVKFDVYVDDKDDEPKSSAAESEFVGSFAQLPHHNTDRMFMTSAARFGLTELLEDIEAEDDDQVMVTLVPRSGAHDLTVSEIKIELVPID